MTQEEFKCQQIDVMADIWARMAARDIWQGVTRAGYRKAHITEDLLAQAMAKAYAAGVRNASVVEKLFDGKPRRKKR